MALENTWIGYVHRSYLQIKQQILSKFPLALPEVTDHNESNPYVRNVSIWAGIAEMLNYYIDNAARESFLSTARLYWSGIKIANAYDYRVKSANAATGYVTFTLSGPATAVVNIPANTIVSTNAGMTYYTTAPATIEIGESIVNVPVQQITDQGVIAAAVGTGLPNQEFELPVNVRDRSLSVVIAALGWENVDTFAYSGPTTGVFVQNVNTNKIPILTFGDGVNGAIPAVGAAINITYDTTEGAAGNIEAGLITTLVSSLVIPPGLTISVTNNDRLSGGSDIESLEMLKKRIPRVNRTNYRAVTATDYVDLAETVAGVALAGYSFSCGKVVTMYIVPDGGGVASPVLLSDVEDFFDGVEMLTTDVEAASAGEVRIFIAVNVRVKTGFVRSTVLAAVKERLVDFMSVPNQKIRGTVQLSDLYEIIETTKGVQDSTIEAVRPQPYAHPMYETVTPLNWSRTLQISSTETHYWEILMLGSTQYELYRDNVFMGIFDVATPYVLAELAFTVNAGPYILGDRYRFYTYNYYGTVSLEEPSVPVSYDADVQITGEGGI